jgi:hypothetical protein
MIINGRSLRAACREMGLDAASTVKYLMADPHLDQQYAYACEIRGNGYGEKVADVAQDVLDGKVMPDVGRVAMDGFKWTAARMASKRWGDKLNVKHGGAVGVFDPSHLSDERLAALAAAVADPSSVGRDAAPGEGGTGEEGGEETT